MKTKKSRERQYKPDKQRNMHKNTDKTKYKTRPIKNWTKTQASKQKSQTQKLLRVEEPLKDAPQKSKHSSLILLYIVITFRYYLFVHISFVYSVFIFCSSPEKITYLNWSLYTMIKFRQVKEKNSKFSNSNEI